MDFLKDIFSLRGLFGVSTLEDEVAEYLIDVPEEKFRKQWKRGEVSIKRFQPGRSRDQNRSELKKEFDLPEPASYDEVLRKKSLDWIDVKVNILNYAVLNIPADYEEDMCYHGDDICVIANSSDLARVMVFLNDYRLFSSILDTDRASPQKFIQIATIDYLYKQTSGTFKTITPVREEHAKECLTLEKLYKKILTEVPPSPDELPWIVPPRRVPVRARGRGPPASSPTD